MSKADFMTLAVGAGLLMLALATTWIHFLMEPARWNYCYLNGSVSSLNPDKRKVRDALYSTAMASYLLPFKLGVPLRVLLLHRSANLGLHRIGVLIGVDGIVTLLVWSLLAFLGIWIAALHLDINPFLWVLAAVLVLILVFSLSILQPKLRSRWLTRLREAIELFDHPGRRIAASVVVLSIDVSSYAVRHAILMLLVTGNLQLMLVGGVVGVVATFAGIVSGLPMGLVGYDATLVALLSSLGVPLHEAILVAVINRILNFSAALLIGVPAALRLGLGTGFFSILGRLRELGRGQK